MMAVIGLALGCGAAADRTTTPTTPPVATATSLQVLDGDDQDGPIGDLLPAEVRFKATDASGQGVPGVVIQLRITEGAGTVPQETVSTDNAGEAHSPWTLGPVPGRHVMEATTGTLPAVSVSATASICDLINCSDNQVADDRSTWKVLDLETYDGSGQATHPDVVRGGPALRWLWMAVTPYPGSDINKENPSLFQSINGRFWRIPKGLTNPVVARPPVGYLSDPDMVYDAPTHRLWMYYRQVTGENLIWLVRSGDGVRWEPPVQVLNAPNHQIISPSVVHNAPHAPWIMFAANTHASGCTSTFTTMDRRTSKDGITWSAPDNTDLVQPGQTIWHLDVEWVPARAEYWAIYNTYPTGSSCVTNAVWFARSRDGIHWQTYSSPVIRKGVLPAFRDIVYRSTILVSANADSVQLWVSGAKFEDGYQWHTATITRRVDELFTELEQPPPAPKPSDLPRRDLPPPEPDVGPTQSGGSGLPATPPLLGRIRP